MQAAAAELAHGRSGGGGATDLQAPATAPFSRRDPAEAQWWWRRSPTGERRSEGAKERERE